MSTKFVYMLLTLVLMYMVSCMYSQPSDLILGAEPTRSYYPSAVSRVGMSASALEVMSDESISLGDSVNLGAMESELQDLAVDVMIFHIDQLELRECFDEID